MIGKSIRRLCKDFTEIENYQEAVNDQNEIWECHHRMEDVFTSEELKRAGWYYHRKPEELIFIRYSEHNGNTNLHIALKRRNERYKGKPAWNKGKTNIYTEEQKQNISIGTKNAMQEMSKAYKKDNKGLTWNEFQSAWKNRSI